jgi:hypothetical protein
VQVSIGDLNWHADESFVAIVNGEPHQRDVYEAGASRITLDGPPDLAERLDIWIFQLTLSGDGGILSDASLVQSPPDISAWSVARMLMIGESTRYSGLDPVPAVMITASLTSLEAVNSDSTTDGLALWQAGFGASEPSAADFNADGQIDGADFLVWQRQLGGSTAVEAATIPEPVVAVLIIAAAWGARRLSARNRS